MLISKRLLVGVKPIVFLAISVAVALPFMLGTLLILGIPTFTPRFFELLFICSFFDTAAAVLYYKALQISEISLIAPISSFNPIFVLVFATFLLHENPTPIKIVGIFIVVIGSYLLNISDIKTGLTKPFKKLFSDRGVQMFLITNFIWGLTPVFQKRALFETKPVSPLSVPLVEGIFIVLMLLPILIKSRSIKSFAIKNSKLLIFFGIMTTFAQFAALSAFALNNVAYASAIFRLSALFSVILGAVFFNEKHIKERFLGASVMIAGTILMAF